MKKNTNNNGLLIAVVVFVGLGALWFFTKDQGKQVGVQTMDVDAVSADAITRITITAPGERKQADAPSEGPVDDSRGPPKVVVLSASQAAQKDPRDGQGVKDPTAAAFDVADGGAPDKRFDADDGLVRALLDAVTALKVGDRVSTRADKLADFELTDDAATRIKVEARDGGFELLFGRPARGGGVTLRQPGSNDVYVADTRLPSLAQKDLSGWRTKALFPALKATDIQGVTITRADAEPVVLTATTMEVPAPTTEDAEQVPSTQKTSWSITAPALPANFRVDTQALSRVAASFASLRASDFADGVDDDATGFSTPRAVITVQRSSGAPLVLTLGKDNDKQQTYARLGDGGQVFLLASYSVKNVDKRLDELRDLTLFTADVTTAERLRIDAGKDVVDVQKKDGVWTRVSPKTAPANWDDSQIGAVVSALGRLKAVRLATSDDGALGKPGVTMTLSGPGGSQTVTIADADADAQEVLVKGSDGLLYVTNGWTQKRYAAPVTLFDAPPPPPPPGMGGGMGGIQGLENLPPDVRKKLEASLRQQQGG